MGSRPRRHDARNGRIVSDWTALGESDHDAGHAREYGAVRTAPIVWGRGRALREWRNGWDTAELRAGHARVERDRALVDAPAMGRIVTALQGADYATRRDTALGLSAQLRTEPERSDIRAMYAGAVASVMAASGLDTGGELYARTRALFDTDPDPDIRACDALRTN